MDENFRYDPRVRTAEQAIAERIITILLLENPPEEAIYEITSAPKPKEVTMAAWTVEAIMNKLVGESTPPTLHMIKSILDGLVISGHVSSGYITSGHVIQDYRLKPTGRTEADRLLHK
jgi:hypothetical protein